MQAKEHDKLSGDSHPVILSHDVMIVNVGTRAEKGICTDGRAESSIAF